MFKNHNVKVRGCDKFYTICICYNMHLRIHEVDGWHHITLENSVEDELEKAYVKNYCFIGSLYFRNETKLAILYTHNEQFLILLFQRNLWMNVNWGQSCFGSL